MTSAVTDSGPAPAQPTWSAGLLAALLATLEQPSSWAAALAGFLARGGVLLFLLPIVVLPTPAGLQAELSPLLRPLVFGQPSPGLILLGAAVASVVACAVVAGGLVGAWADVLLIRQAASALGAGTAVTPPSRRHVVVSVFVARLLAHLPLAVAMAWGAIRIVEVTYRELVTPFEVVTPLFIRVVSGAPDALAFVALAWWLGEAAGALAAREIVLGGRSTVRAAAGGWGDLLRRPLGSAATLAASTLAIGLAIVPALIASGTAWARLRFALFEALEPQAIGLALVLFIALWLGGLVLGAVAAAARSAMWTAEWLRRARVVAGATAGWVPDRVGTIGDGDGTDRGGWPSSEGSGTL